MTENEHEQEEEDIVTEEQEGKEQKAGKGNKGDLVGKKKEGKMGQKVVFYRPAFVFCNHRRGCNKRLPLFSK